MNKKFYFAVLGAALPLLASAIPAKPGPITVTQPDGTELVVRLAGDERHHVMYSEDGLMLIEDENGWYRYAEQSDNLRPAAGRVAMPVALRSADDIVYLAAIDQDALKADTEQLSLSSRLNSAYDARQLTPRSGKKRSVGLCDKAFPGKGEPHAIVVLVEYTDIKFDIDDPNDYFTRMLNEEGFSDFGGTGSARDFFVSNSNGQFKPTFDVYGPVPLQNNRKYYGQNDYYGDDMRAEQMVIEACEYLDATVDFSQYDHDGDGFIDNVFVFYAGGGEHDKGAPSTAVWPHAANLAEWYETPFIYDGVQLNSYGCTCETPNGVDRPDGIGTFVHEFCHVMGLPDLYHTLNSSVKVTPGYWSVLDYGPYNNDGRTPPNFSSYELTALDWIEATPFGDGGRYTLENLIDSHQAYIIPSDSPNEFYLLENRQQTGNDLYLPGHGMLIWHIDYDHDAWEQNVVNNSISRQRVDLVEANNSTEDDFRDGNPFPGADMKTSFGPSTNPALTFRNKSQVDALLTHIEEAAGIIAFRYNDPGESTVCELIKTEGYTLNEALLTTALPAEIYTLAGNRIARLDGGDSFMLPARGVYVIRTSAGTEKIIY